jgi:hypothetical protein
MIPNSPDVLLPRAPTAHALTALGYPVAPSTLATKASRGDGPPYRRFGRKPLYRWGDALAWAQSRMSALIDPSSANSATIASGRSDSQAA